MQTWTRRGATLAVALLGISVGGSRALAQDDSPGTAPAPQAKAPAPGQGKNVVVHLTRFRENPHAATMALELAQAMQRQGARVTLFLDTDGVQLADSRAKVAGREGSTALGTPSITASFDSFVSAGGKVVVCAHCAKVANLDEQSLRRGATLVRGDESARLVTGADQIIDY